jgi:hypothetical protein
MKYLFFVVIIITALCQNLHAMEEKKTRLDIQSKVFSPEIISNIVINLLPKSGINTKEELIEFIKNFITLSKVNKQIHSSLDNELARTYIIKELAKKIKFPKIIKETLGVIPSQSPFFLLLTKVYITLESLKEYIQKDNILQTEKYLEEIHGTDFYIDGTPALDYVLEFGSTEMLKLFLDHGALIKPEDLKKIVSGQNRYKDAYNKIALLLSYGIDVNTKFSNGNTPLLESITLNLDENSLKIIRLLLEHGANANALSSDGGTALITLAYLPSSEIQLNIAKLLLAHEAQINKGTSNNNIFYALALSGNNNTALLNLFLKNTDPQTIDPEFLETAIALAKDDDSDDLAELIEQWAEENNISLD